ncbi:MAG: multicopper oxidase domain-containing protein [Deltaproteobacteria bacterium]|nr:multicopper oxidase domain-containing protein [Deltaproteobacteria bacterium]
MSFQSPAHRVARWSVAGMEGMFCKMFDPPTASPETPDHVVPTNPVPEVMAAAGLLKGPSTPNTIKPDLMHGLKIPTWDGAKELMFFLIRDGDIPAAVGTFPGPTIRIPRGAIFHADTQGHGPPPHTIHWHGIEPTPMNDGVGHCSIEIGHYRYQFQPNFIGSYFYHCHRNTMQHFEFGLYGFLVIEAPDAYFATQLLGAPIGAGRDGKRRTAANLRTATNKFGQVTDFSSVFPGFNGNDVRSPDPLANDPTLPAALKFLTDPHAMTVTYDVEALWVFDDRDSVWSDLAPNARATYPKHGDVPGVNDNFHGNAGGGVGPDDFFAFNDFNADYWFVTGVPVPAHKGGVGEIPRDITIPAALNSGIEGTQVPIKAQAGQTILLRVLNGAYNCTEITFPVGVDVLIIGWDGRPLGVPPYGQYNHAYQVAAGTPIHISVARRFDCLIRVNGELNDFATIKFVNTRGQVPVDGVDFGPQFSNDVLVTAKIPIDIGEAPAAPTFAIRGTIRDAAGAPVDAVRVEVEPMSLAGSKPAPVFTNAAGEFVVSGLLDSMYQVTPHEDGIAFDPPFVRVTVNGADVAAGNFTATAAPFSKLDSDEALELCKDGRAPTAEQLGRLDVGPVVGGHSAPDGKVDLHDVVTIMKLSTGEPL